MLLIQRYMQGGYSMGSVSKRICIYGLGGIGGYLGGMLAYNAGKSEAESYEVYFTARGKHLKQ